MLIQAGREASANVKMAEKTERAVETPPTGCEVKRAKGGEEKGMTWVSFFIDDAKSVKGRWEKDWGRCLDLPRSLALKCTSRQWGRGGEGYMPPLQHKKMSDWASQREVLGFMLGIEAMSTTPLRPRER